MSLYVYTGCMNIVYQIHNVHTHTALVSSLILMLLATQTISQATASTQQTCRRCSSGIPANCTHEIEKGILDCYVNFSSCPMITCAGDDYIFCSYSFTNISNKIMWIFNSGCSTSVVEENTCAFHESWSCIAGVSSVNGFDPEVVEYSTEFNFNLTREGECSIETCLLWSPCKQVTL